MAEDAVTVAPAYYKSIFENDRVRLLEYRGGPGAKTEMHHHPDVVAYALEGGVFKFNPPDCPSFEIELKNGETAFVEAQDHAAENVGTTQAYILLVELK